MRIIRNVIIALLAALLAGGVGFYGYMSRSEEKKGVSINTEELEKLSVLPDIYAYFEGAKINRMEGYTENSASYAGRGDLTILPEDRKLKILITETEDEISGIWYEIRDLSGDNFIERTTVENWQKTDGGVTAVLPIENIIEKGEQYRLTICISGADYPAAYYYCRIIDNSKIGEYLYGMISLAQEFSSKIYNYNDARDLTTYLESNSTADNSSLGHITLENSYNQLTYNNSKITRRGDADLHIKEALGNMAVVSLNSLAVKDYDNGKEEFFDIDESFTMRQGPERIYMMSYDRHMNQIFTGDSDSFSNKNVRLGISDGEGLQVLTDESKAFTAWVSNGSVWCASSADNAAYQVYSTRNTNDDFDGSKSIIRMLKLDSEGNLDFTVSGYMNNGKHEGKTGTALFHFDMDDESVTEDLFIDGYASAGEIIKEETAWSYLNDEDVFYISMGGTFCSVTPEGEETVIVRNPKRIYSSPEHELVAWQKDDRTIDIMNLDSGETDEHRAASGQELKLIGFVGTDMVYGVISESAAPYGNGSRTVLPMERIIIENAEGEQEACYEKPGMVLVDAYIDKSRVHISRAYYDGSSYEDLSEDTLICNDEMGLGGQEGISSSIDNVWGRVYYALLGQESKKSLKPNGVDRLAAESRDVVISKPENRQAFLSYSDGRYAGSYTEFYDAAEAAYEGMGIVTDINDRVIWARADRKDSITIRDIGGLTPVLKDYLAQFDEGRSVAEDGTLLLDCSGMALGQILYFVSKGTPVVAYNYDGSYGFVYGYDTWNISMCWYPGTEYEYTEKIGIQDATAYFESHGNNRFVAFLR